MSKITVFGGANMDILGMPQDELRLRDSNIGRIVMRPGGVGRNIAQHAARFGAACTLLTVFGDDSLSDALRAACRREGIDISHALNAHGAACTYLSVHDGEGDMLVAVNDMALAARLSPAYAAEALPVIDQSDLCVLDANPPAETLRYIAQHTRAPLLMDPVSCAKIDRAQAVLPYLAAIKPNIHEARALTGCHAAQDCARKLIKMGARRAFVSLGAEGLCCADDQQCVLLPVEHPSSAVKTGAGDALCAGLAVALAAGEGTLASAQYGMRCAERFLSQQIQEEEQ